MEVVKGFSEDLEDDQSAFPWSGCCEKKKDGISVPIKKRVTSLPTLSLKKIPPLQKCVQCYMCSSKTTKSPANEQANGIDC